MEPTVVYLLIGLVLILLIRQWTRPKQLQSYSSWRNFFEGVHFSSKEFYSLVEKTIKEQKIKHVEFDIVEFHEGGIFSSKRDYLRITWKNYIFDICAAPFGSGVFVSWWQGLDNPKLISKIPVLNTLAGENFEAKTYFQKDTEAMFRSLINKCFMEAIGKITAGKGIQISDLSNIQIETVVA